MKSCVYIIGSDFNCNTVPFGVNYVAVFGYQRHAREALLINHFLQKFFDAWLNYLVDSRVNSTGRILRRIPCASREQQQHRQAISTAIRCRLSYLQIPSQ